jgi:lambda family phage tail tape measure protein
VGCFFVALTIHQNLWRYANVSDNELAIKITADASEVKESTDEAKEHIEKAAGSVAMLGDLIGVKVPEGVQKMLAQTQLVGPAMEAAFTPLAVISLVKAVADVIDKIKQHNEELEKETRSAREAADSIGKIGESLRISTLRLQDQINVYNKIPKTNTLAILLGEASQKADQLTEAIQRAIDKDNELLADMAQGSLAKMLLGTDDLQKLVNTAAEGVKGYDLALKEIRQQIDSDEKARNEKAAAADRVKYQQKLAKYVEFLHNQQTALDTYRQKRTDSLQEPTYEIDEGLGHVVPGMGEDAAMAAATQETKEFQGALNILRTTALSSVNVFKDLAANTSAAIGDKKAQAAREMQEFFDKALRSHDKILSATKQEQEAGKEQEAVDNARIAVNNILADQANKELAVMEKRAQADEKIAQLTRDVADTQAEHNAKLSVAFGYETQEQAAQRALKQVEQDKKTALDNINSRLTAQIAIVKQLGEATMNGLLGSPQQKAAYQKAVTDYQNLKIQELELEKKYDKQIAALRAGLTDSFVVQLRKQALAWQDVQKEMERTFFSTLNGMNQNLASFITTGQANWRQLATSAIEEIIKIGLQWVESQILMKVLGIQTSKETAGSNIMASAASGAAAAGASVAAIPMIGWSMVQAVSDETYATLAAFQAGIAGFALGGIVPATGLALVHRGERILPASMSGTGAGIGGGHTFNLHYHISGLDGADITDTYKSKLRPMIKRDLLKILKKAGGS